MFMNLFMIVTIVLVLFSIYFIITKKCYGYWTQRGVAGPKPVFPFGNILTRLTKPSKPFELDLLRKYGKVYGFYYGWTPALTIIEPELIKQVLIKDFPFLVNRRKLKVFHEYWNLNLFQLPADEWKRVRSIMSPAFTSGKLRAMYRLMDKCVDRLDQYLDYRCHEQQQRCSIEDSHCCPIDGKKICMGLTIDVIALTSFATDTNANDIRKRDNQFVQHGLKFFDMPKTSLLAYWAFPKFINNLLNVTHIFCPESLNFFLELSKRIIKERKHIKDDNTKTIKNNDQKSNRRIDLVQLLIETYAYEHELNRNDNYDHLTATVDRKDPRDAESETESMKMSRKYLTEKEIVAQCLLFFVAGFETTATTLTFALYELAMNPECQECLVDKLREFHEENRNQILEQYCEKLMTDVPYLDAVIKETLRKYPPLTRLERSVGVDGYQLNGIPLAKGTVIEVPVLAVHYCPDHYAEPERFDPERFMPHNRHLLKPYAYVPFGIGPRNCIGMRFAYQELKLALCKLLLKFRFRPIAKTPKTIDFPKGAILNIVSELPMGTEFRNPSNT